MTPLARGTTLLLVGAMLIRLTVTDAFQRYVRVGMGHWLLIAGVLLAGLGAVAVVTALRSDPAPEPPPAEPADHDVADHADHDDHDDHDHEHGDRIGWLLLVPVLALLLVVPPALGSFGVDRSTVTSSSADVFEPLPAGAGPRTMTLLEFDQRAFDRKGQSMQRAELRLTGFVARPADGNGFRLARYQIACCAADAVAAVVRLVGLGAEPVRDSWLTVTGSYRGAGPDGVPELTVTSSHAITAPTDPYES